MTTNQSLHKCIIDKCLSLTKCFLSAGSPASTPAKSRVVEAVCILLCQKYRQSKREVDSGKITYKSRWKLIISEYSSIRARLLNSPVLEEINLMLYSINQTTLVKWFKDEVRRQEITLLMQGLFLHSSNSVLMKVYYQLESFPLLLVHLQSILTSSLSQKIQLEQSNIEPGGNHLHPVLLVSILPLLPVLLSL